MIELEIGEARQITGLVFDLKIEVEDGRLILKCDFPSGLPRNTRKRIHYGLSLIRKLFIIPRR